MKRGRKPTNLLPGQRSGQPERIVPADRAGVALYAVVRDRSSRLRFDENCWTTRTGHGGTKGRAERMKEGKGEVLGRRTRQKNEDEDSGRVERVRGSTFRVEVAIRYN
jgi:hypothetical protein